MASPDSPKPVFDHIALIGIGHIGASLAMAVRKHGVAKQISGYVPSASSRASVEKLGLVDHLHESPGDAVKTADLVVIAAPVGAYKTIGEQIAPFIKKNAIISDVGSCKEIVVEALTPFLPDHCHFIPGHPIAGTEHSGPEAGVEGLFENRYCILTPPPGTSPDAIARLSRFWQGIGTTVDVMEPNRHDRVLAITSHLPHVLAYAIVRTAADLEAQLMAENRLDPEIIHSGEVMRYSAGGFRDFTRIAGSNPVMWRDIFLANKAPILEMIDRFEEDLLQLRRAIRTGDGDHLHKWFTDTRIVRRGIVEQKQAGTFIPTELETGVED